MNYGFYRDIISLIGLLMFFYYIIRYKGIKEKMDLIIYIYIATFPFDINRIIPYFDMLLKALLIVGVLKICFNEKKIKVNLYELVYLIIVFMTSIINIYSNNYNIFNSYLLNLIFVLFFSFYAYNSVLTLKQFKEIAKVFVLNSSVLTILAFVEHYIIGVSRPQTSLGNPNYFGLYILISLLLLYYIMPKITLKSIIISMMFAFSIKISGSNSLLLILLVLVVYYFIIKLNLKIVQRIFGVSIVVITIFYVYVTIVSFEISGIFSVFVKDDLLRVYLWQESWNTFKNNLIHGVGYGALLIPFEKYNFVTHNDYLRIMGEIGLLGILIMMKYLASEYKIILQFDNKTKFFLGGCLISILIFSLTHNNMNSLLFWWFIALPLHFKSIGVIRQIRTLT